MIVIERNGKTTVLTGWRAWLAGTVAFLAVAGFLFIFAFLLLGLTITFFTMMIVLVPAGLAVWLIASIFNSPRTR